MRASTFAATSAGVIVLAAACGGRVASDVGGYGGNGGVPAAGGVSSGGTSGGAGTATGGFGGWDAGIGGAWDAGIGGGWDAGIGGGWDAGIGGAWDGGAGGVWEAGVDAGDAASDVCPPGLALCGSSCVDLASDVDHCGACNSPCPTFCAAGQCPKVTDFSLGAAHTCAALSDGTVRCWGNGNSGQCGKEAQPWTNEPMAVSGAADAVAVALGSAHSCALRSDKSVQCWGQNIVGQLGAGPLASAVKIPMLIPAPPSFDQIAAGGTHTCGSVGAFAYCWGENDSGQLGDATTDNKLAPVMVPGLDPVIQFSMGRYHTCALLQLHDVKCWGSNYYGQLGTGTTVSSTTPVSVIGIQNAVELAVGYLFTCARLYDGTVKCWGRNESGQLGQFPGFPITTPTAVLDIATATSIAAGNAHACAVLDSGGVKCWGDNSFGQVGSGSAKANFPKPQHVSGLSQVARVEAGAEHTCALTKSGELWCWGRNTLGQLGDGTNLDKNVPTPVIW